MAIRFGASLRDAGPPAAAAGGGTTLSSSFPRDIIPPNRPDRAPALREGVRFLNDIAPVAFCRMPTGGEVAKWSGGEVDMEEIAVGDRGSNSAITCLGAGDDMLVGRVRLTRSFAIACVG